MPPAPSSDPRVSRAPAYRALAVTVVTLALAYGVWYASQEPFRCSRS